MSAHIEPHSRFVDLGGTRRHVVEWGRTDGPVLFLQHGMRDHARSWEWVANHFARNYRIVAPDLRGHGDSEWSQEGAYSLFDYVIDLRRIAVALELDSFHLVGHSLGGHISLRYAAAFPETILSLSIIEGVELPIVREQKRTPIPYSVRLRDWIANQSDLQRRTPRFYASLEEAIARMATQHPRIDADKIAHLAVHGAIMETERGWRWKFDNACRHRAPDDAYGHDLDDVLSAITAPVLLAYGKESWIPVPPPERLDRLVDHRVKTFPGASHWLHHERLERFVAVLGDFLSSSQSLPIREKNHA